jgi:hypothetical protein
MHFTLNKCFASAAIANCRQIYYAEESVCLLVFAGILIDAVYAALQIFACAMIGKHGNASAPVGEL